VSTTIVNTWTATATEQLLESQNADGGWPYRTGDSSSTEPTSLALLALSASGGADSAIASASSYLTSRQRPDGLFTASESHLDASWCSPLAAIGLRRAGQSSPADAAASALLSEPVFTFSGAVALGLYDYDTGIPGWPWTFGDYSFVEPTALAMVFLKQSGSGSEVRVRQGGDMLRARALAAGGWNYGEPKVLGGELFTTVAPTAAALLALADEPDEVTAAALSRLLEQRGQISSLFSLGWASIALNVVQTLDDGWRDDVVTLWSSLPAERRGPLETALCLLGVSDSPQHPFALP